MHPLHLIAQTDYMDWTISHGGWHCSMHCGTVRWREYLCMQSECLDLLTMPGKLALVVTQHTRSKKVAAILRHKFTFINCISRANLINLSGCVVSWEEGSRQGSSVLSAAHLPAAEKSTNIPPKKVNTELDNYLKSELILLFIRERESLTHHIS